MLYLSIPNQDKQRAKDAAYTLSFKRKSCRLTWAALEDVCSEVKERLAQSRMWNIAKERERGSTRNRKTVTGGEGLGWWKSKDPTY